MAPLDLNVDRLSEKAQRLLLEMEDAPTLPDGEAVDEQYPYAHRAWWASCEVVEHLTANIATFVSIAMNRHGRTFQEGVNQILHMVVRELMNRAAQKEEFALQAWGDMLLQDRLFKKLGMDVGDGPKHERLLDALDDVSGKNLPVWKELVAVYVYQTLEETSEGLTLMYDEASLQQEFFNNE